MKYNLFFLFLFNALSLKSQHGQLLECAVKLDTSTSWANVEVFIISDPRCGFCSKAIRDIGNWSNGKSVKIIAMDISGKPASVQKLDLYRGHKVEVRDASGCGEKFRKFIPKIYIKDAKTNRFIATLRGWHTRDLAKLERKLKRYI